MQNDSEEERARALRLERVKICTAADLMKMQRVNSPSEFIKNTYYWLIEDSKTNIAVRCEFLSIVNNFIYKENSINVIIYFEGHQEHYTKIFNFNNTLFYIYENDT